MRFVLILVCVFLAAVAVADDSIPDRRVTHAVDISYGESVRRVVEYDDRWRDGPEPLGNAAVRRAVAALSYRVAPRFSLVARAGAASVEMKDFEGPHAVSYEQAYDFGPTWGLGLRADLGSIGRAGVAIKAFTDFNWTRPATWNSTVHAEVDPYRAFVTDWQFGLRAERQWPRWGCFAGARWSDANVLYEHNSQAFPGQLRQGGYEASQHVGAVAGVSWRITRECRFTLQGSGFDANGGEAKVSYDF